MRASGARWSGAAIAGGGVAGVLGALLVLRFPSVGGTFGYVVLPALPPILMLLGLPGLRRALAVREAAPAGFLLVAAGLVISAVGRVAFAAVVLAEEPALGVSIGALALGWGGGLVVALGLLWIGAALARATERSAARWLLPAMGAIQSFAVPANAYADVARLFVNVGWVVVGVVTLFGGWRRESS